MVDWFKSKQFMSQILIVTEIIYLTLVWHLCFYFPKGMLTLSGWYIQLHYCYAYLLKQFIAYQTFFF